MAGDEYIGVHTGAVGAWGRLMKAVGLDDRVSSSENGLDMGVPLTPEERVIMDGEIHDIFASRSRRDGNSGSPKPTSAPFRCSDPVRCSTRRRPRTTAWWSTSTIPCSAPFSKSPVRLVLGGGPRAGPAPAPSSGQHTAEILAELRECRREPPQEVARAGRRPPAAPGRAQGPGHGRLLRRPVFLQAACRPRRRCHQASSQSPANRVRGLHRSFRSANAGKRRSPRTSRIPPWAWCSTA